MATLAASPTKHPLFISAICTIAGLIKLNQIKLIITFQGGSAPQKRLCVGWQLIKFPIWGQNLEAIVLVRIGTYNTHAHTHTHSQNPAKCS